jgi:hypothetical protein
LLTLERNLLLERLGRVEAKELSKLGSIVRVLVDTELDVLAKGLVELLEVVLVLGDLAYQVQTLLDDVLTDDLQDLVLLKSLTRNVQRKVLRVNDT